MNKLFLVLVALGILFGASSCKYWRRVTGRQKAAVVIDSALAVNTDSLIAPPIIDSEKLAALEKWLPIWNAQTAYSTFSGRAKMDYEGGGESHELNANIRMERDKRIWISITAVLGVEVARALITPDTIIAINRIDKEVRILPFAEADKLLPVHADFATLQSLIIGDVLRTGHMPNELVDTTDGVVVLAAIDSGFIQQVRFNREDTLLISQSLSSATSTLVSAYRNYDIISGRRFAKTRELTMQDKGDRHRIMLEFNKVSFDEPVDMNISIPAKYERK
jgi:hypothetical protein